ncbi:polysaccharide biosynthesis C-terminal domain-containing protein [Alicyclobacillus tolerans]|uniref:oligosaccharide flippase family protein n=1 Tax=Alicyclobacillus tolerans TaxID=90970 RepID=UPI001F45853D|nr:polysaccharide biosynthesis C-terminal domain-containing protein [Alicyclobacillus tolerans]MCF8567690.1 polysaccharide biosynthesis C-terminal domain-containing protein [Alicyclobacillus tolerans]
MSKDLKSLAYTGGEILSRVGKFLGNILIARAIGASGYGLISFASVLSQYVNFMDVGIVSTAMSNNSDSGLSNRYYNDIQSVRIRVAIVGALLYLGMGILVIKNPTSRLVMVVYSFVVIISALNGSWVLTATHHANYTGLTRVFDGGAYLVFAILCLLVPSLHLPQIATLSVLFGVLAATLFSKWIIRPYLLSAEVTRLRAGGVLRASLPLGLSMLLINAYNTIDTIILQIYWGSSTVGNYSAAYRMVQFVIAAGTTFAQSLIPYFATLFSSNDKITVKILGSKYINMTLYVGILVCLTVFDLRNLVSSLFGTTFSEASLALSILIWSAPIVILYSIINSILIAFKKNKYIVNVAIIGFLFDSLLSFILIPHFSIVGAGIATIICEISVLVVELWMVGRMLRGFGPWNIHVIRLGSVGAISEALYFAVHSYLGTWFSIPILWIFYILITLWFMPSIRLKIREVLYMIKSVNTKKEFDGGR